MDEANTKAAVLRDFLGLLEWEIPTNTQLEYSVEAFGQTYKVDYALILEGTPVAFLEAKGADTALTAKHNEQLSSYMMNKNVTYGILTNGKQYRFFQRRVDASNVDVQKVGDVPLEDLPNRLAVLKAYEKDAIESGESGKILGRINEFREARRTLEADKDDLAVELSNVLADHVSETISSIAEMQAKEMVDSVIQDIEAEIDSDRQDSGNEDRTFNSQSASDNPSNTRQKPEEEDQHSGATSTKVQRSSEEEEPFDKSGRWVVTFLDNESEVAAVSGHKQDETMINATNYLITHHNLISKIEPLPWVPGRTKAIINDVPEREQADPEYKPLVNGYYLDTKLAKGAKKTEIQRMAKKCGIHVDFEGDW
ncbi:type I restriction enzyme HsdR N-terminal domain-containing protein [Halopiger djelfimassiliensis]|uniref:type I restriction enzyme HsdR N-terminal domain-containing protein n=1 Tax=Halopiger djelfimassiliensis TaxID=1293047 RepID=UPI001E361FB1|nr:type I restriction enzyme HsdR N-terminal domain-containing protein [Halopiger djelfimassiliensis]